tara:strand:+ start:176 stop:427 length:252 start_codon:yes stop_codon:yes gene_type:complete
VKKAKNPKGKKELLGYFHALHDELEKEFNYTAKELKAMSVAELKKSTMRFTEQLFETLNGKEAVDRAKRSAMQSYQWLMKASA